MKPNKWMAGGMLLVLLLLAARPAFAADAPTPYPENDKNWPGRGVIRKFDWMVDNRAYYWTQREKDQGAVVFVGDTLTGNWKDLAKAFPNLKVAKRGIGGDTSRGLLFRFQEDVLDLHPRALVILIGTNDLTAFGKAADALANISDMLDMANRQDPKLPVVLCTLPPSASPKSPVRPWERRAFNEGIVKLAAAKPNITLCDLFQVLAGPDDSPIAEYFMVDRLHLAGPGYARWGSTLKGIFAMLKLEQPTTEPAK